MSEAKDSNQSEGAAPKPYALELQSGASLRAASCTAVCVIYSSATDEWATPQAFFDAQNAVHRFTLDVCATAENAKCARYFTRDDNALTKSWAGERCWMNPPYGRDIGKWVQKAWIESQRGALVVCLVPARTDVRWWHDYAVKSEVYFVKGRLKFRTIKGEILRKEVASVKEGRHAPNAHAPFASAVLMFKPQNNRQNP